MNVGLGVSAAIVIGAGSGAAGAASTATNSLAAIVIGAAPYVFILNAISAVRTVYTIAIVAWAIFSWFDHSKGALRDIYTILDKLVGPFVGLFRKRIPSLGGIDFSPLVAVVVIQLFTQILVWIVQFIFTPY